MTDTITMYDATGVNTANIPVGAKKVAGYVTGTGGVKWGPGSWAAFPNAGRVRIDQSPAGALFAIGDADVYDIENRAGTPAAFPGLVEQRISRGIRWSAGYGGRAALAAAVAALKHHEPAARIGKKGSWYYGHVDWWLADWDLSQAQAAALVGRELDGITVRAVQWASPTSNPHTPLPNGASLAAANVDLSVADAAWFPAPAAAPPPLAWQARALQLARQLEKDAAELATLIGHHQ